MRYSHKEILDIKNKYGIEAAIYAITTTTLGSSIVQPEIADRYIQEVIEQTRIVNAARRLPMMSDKRNIDRLTHSGRVLVKGTEGSAPSAAGAVAFAQRQLSVVEWVTAEDFTQQTIEDNIEGDMFESTLIDVMSRLFSRDLEELALYANADDTTTPAFPDSDNNGDAFREIQTHDGWLLLSNNLTDNAGSQPADMQTVFKTLMDAIPAKILESRPRSDWRFYVASAADRKYREEIGQRATPLGDQVLFNNAPVSYDGVPVEVSQNLRLETRDFTGSADITNVTDAMLVVPENLVVGFRRDLSIDVEWVPRKRQWELTITSRGDFEVEDPDAYATLINYKLPA